MRPVNLIPAKERRGGSAPSRTGASAYILVGALALLVVGVVALVITKNDVSGSQAEVARLEQQKTVATARAEKLAAYTQFRTVRDVRATTVATLAGTRFDWERVMRELSMVLPGDVWIKQLTATVAPTVIIEGALTIESRAQVAGPAVEILGCAASQDAVARFIPALRGIDGVTRVGLQKSGIDQNATAGGGTSGVSTDETKCPTTGGIVTFELVVAFDDAPAAIAESAAVSGAAAGAETAPSDPNTAAQAGTADTSGVTGTQQEQQTATDSANSQIDKANRAKSAILGGTN